MKAISSLLSSNKKRKSMAATKDRPRILDTTPASSAPPSPPLSPLSYPHRKHPVPTSASASTITSFTTIASLDYDSEHTYDYNDRPQVPGFFESPRAVPPIPSTSSSISSLAPPPTLSPPRSPSRLSLKNASIPWVSKSKPAGHTGVPSRPQIEGLVPNAAGDRRTVSYSTSSHKASPAPEPLPSTRSSMARRAMSVMMTPRDDSLRAASKHANKLGKRSLPPHYVSEPSNIDPATDTGVWDPFAARSPLSPSSSPVIAPPLAPVAPPSPPSSGRLGKGIHRLLHSRSSHALRERAHRIESSRPSSRGNGSRPPSRGNGSRPREGSLPTPKLSSSSFARRRAQSVGAPAPAGSFDLACSGLPPPPAPRIEPAVNASTSPIKSSSTTGNSTRYQGLGALFSSPSPSPSPTPSTSRKLLLQHPLPSPSPTKSQFHSSFPSLLWIDSSTDSDAGSRDRSNSTGTGSTSASSSPHMPNHPHVSARRGSGMRRNPSVSSKRSMPELDGVWKSFVRDCAEDIDLDIRVMDPGLDAVVEESHGAGAGGGGGAGQQPQKAEVRKSRRKSTMNGAVKAPTRPLPVVPPPPPPATRSLAIRTTLLSSSPFASTPSVPLPTPPFTPTEGTTQVASTNHSEAYDLGSVDFGEGENEKSAPPKYSLRPVSTCTTSSSRTLTLSNMSGDVNRGDMSNTPTLSSGPFPVQVFPAGFQRVPASPLKSPKITESDSRAGQASNVPVSSVRPRALQTLDAPRPGSTLSLSSFPQPPSHVATAAPGMHPRPLPSRLPVKARRTLPLMAPPLATSAEGSPFLRSVGSAAREDDKIPSAGNLDREYLWTVSESSLAGDHGHESSATSSLYDTAESSFSCGSDIAADARSSRSSRATTASDSPSNQNHTITSRTLTALLESQPQSYSLPPAQLPYRDLYHHQRSQLQQLSSMERRRSISPPFARMQAELQLLDLELPRTPRLRHSSPASSPVLSSTSFHHTPSHIGKKSPLYHARGYSFDGGYAM